MTEPDALERIALRSAAAAAELAEVERALEAEDLTTEQLGALEDRRTLAEHELADLAGELRALDAPANGGPPSHNARS
jgi:hypothetical protein